MSEVEEATRDKTTDATSDAPDAAGSEETTGTWEFSVSGMTCEHCEMTVSAAAMSVAGVSSASADAAHALVVLSGDWEGSDGPDGKTRRAVADAISVSGYAPDLRSMGLSDACGEGPRGKESGDKYGKRKPGDVSGDAPRGTLALVGLLVASAVLAYAFSRSGLLSMTIPAIESAAVLPTPVIPYLLLGLACSVHCVAMCGGIATMAVSPSLLSGTGDDGGTDGTDRADGSARKGAHSLRPVLAYNLGRLIGYSAVGAVLGAFGSRVMPSVYARSLIGIALALVTVLVGAVLTGLVPGLSRLVPRLPMSARNALSSVSGGRPLLVGVANALMPCGPLQAMQLAALTTGSAAMGAATMAAFCLGTMPAMTLAVSLMRRATSGAKRAVAIAGGTVVMVMGFVAFVGNATIAGVLPAGSSGAIESATAVDADAWREEGFQVVESGMEPNRYPDVTLEAGVPAKWVIHADEGDLNGCNQSLLLPEWDMQVDLQEGDNVIEIPATEAGTYGYSCWMGMIAATVTVE